MLGANSSEKEVWSHHRGLGLFSRGPHLLVARRSIHRFLAHLLPYGTLRILDEGDQLILHAQGPPVPWSVIVKVVSLREGLILNERLLFRFLSLGV